MCLSVMLGMLSLTAIPRLIAMWAGLSKEDLKPHLRGLCLSYLHTNNIRVKRGNCKLFSHFFRGPQITTGRASGGLFHKSLITNDLGRQAGVTC
jgi:hypothetical protein